MADWGLKITRTGVDAVSADPKDMVLTSQHYTLKAFERATTTITLLAGNDFVQKSFVHGFNYAPLVIAHAEMNPGKWYQINNLVNIPIESSPGDFFNISWNVDVDRVYFNLFSDITFGSNQTYNISYYIIVDQL